MEIFTNIKQTLCLTILGPKLIVSGKRFMVSVIYGTGICAKHQATSLWFM